MTFKPYYLGLLASLAFLASCGIAQEPPLFQTGVALVHVDAEVAAPDGRILTGFTRDDFRVFDNGKEQRVVHFSAGDEPLDLIILFDISGSMRPKVRTWPPPPAKAFRSCGRATAFR